MSKTAIITGIAGQDGAFLSQFLIAQGYKIYGIDYKVRASYWRLEYLGVDEHVEIIDLDLLNYELTRKTIIELKPNEIYNLAGLSSVSKSFKEPKLSFKYNSEVVLNLLEIIRLDLPTTRFFQASSSEMFGNTSTITKLESTQFNPISPYAVCKLFGHYLVDTYRNAYGLYVVSGILFNHESPLRGKEFVTKKIIETVVKIKNETTEYLEIGNLNIKRDWGHAKDYVEAMWLMTQQYIPDNFVIATNKVYSLRQFIEMAFRLIGLEIRWKGDGLQEVGIDQHQKIRVKVSSEFFRPNDLAITMGNNSKAKTKLNWCPNTLLEDIIEEMLNYEITKSYSI